MSNTIARAALTDALALLTPVDAVGLDKRRLGNASDGGYIVAGAFLDGTHAAYSFGIGPDVSIDLDLADLGIPVRMFDHTVEGPGTAHEFFTFYKLGLGAANEPAQALFTLEHHLRACGDWGRTDLILKMDIEGAEIPAFAQCGPGILRHFRQIVLELHWLQRLGELDYRAEFTRAMTALAAGFHIVHVHANNCVPVFVVEGLPVPAVLELTLVRKDLIEATPSRTVYPTELDFPNNPAEPDYPLWYFPFLPAFGPAEAKHALGTMGGRHLRQAEYHPPLPTPAAPTPPAALAMTDEAMVRALFLLCLGREADQAGLNSFTSYLSLTADKSLLLAGLLQSDEYARAVAAGRVPGVGIDGYRLGPSPTKAPLDEDRLRAMVPALSKMLLTTPNIFGDPERVQIGQGVQLINTLFNVSSGTITVGDYVFFGHNVCLLTGTHDADKFDLDRQVSIPLSGRDIVIGRGAWIATNVTVIGPCTIGADAVVAAGSVVVEDVPAGWMVAGVPARAIKPVAAKFG